MKKIAIVEDDQEVAKELQELLNHAGYQAILLQDFINIVDQICSSHADLILLDIQIPYQNGEIVLKEVRQKTQVPIIMVTSKNNEADEVLSMTYGADDYITKPYHPAILLLHIESIFKRMDHTTDQITYRDLQINLQKGTIASDTKELILTKNELILFTCLWKNKNRIVSRETLMTDLWNHHEYISDNALTVNMSRLRSKLKELGYVDMIETRKKEGYILK